jgi:hypothetical protein
MRNSSSAELPHSPLSGARGDLKGFASELNIRLGLIEKVIIKITKQSQLQCLLIKNKVSNN